MRLLDAAGLAVLGDALVGQWEDVERFEEELSRIVLSDSPLPGEISQAVIQMDALYSQVLPEWTRAKVLLDNVEDLIEEVTKANRAGRNADARVVASYEAARNYDIGGVQVNLFEARRYARARFAALDSIIRALDKKHARIITIEGAYKIEPQFAPA